MASNGEGDLYLMVGSLVIRWGVAEFPLTAMVSMLYQMRRARGVTKPKKHPVLLEPKLRFIEDSIEAMPELGVAMQETLRNIVSGFRRLSKLRHDVIHGAITSVAAEDGGFSFVKLDHTDPHVPSVRNLRLAVQDFPMILADVDDLTRLSQAATRTLMDRLIDVSGKQAAPE